MLSKPTYYFKIVIYAPLLSHGSEESRLEGTGDFSH